MAENLGKEQVAIPVLWEGLDSAEIKFVNQMIAQLGPPGHEGEFLLTLGQLHPPVLMGSPDENKDKLESLPFVSVGVVAKVAIPVERVRQLRDLLTNMLDTYERTTGKG